MSCAISRPLVGPSTLGAIARRAEGTHLDLPPRHHDGRGAATHPGPHCSGDSRRPRGPTHEGSTVLADPMVATRPATPRTTGRKVDREGNDLGGTPSWDRRES